MYEIFFFIKYISQKKEKEVNNLTPDCVQNFIYPLVGFKCDSIKQNILNKSQNLLLKDFIKNELSTAYYPFRIKYRTKNVHSFDSYFQNCLYCNFDIRLWGNSMSSYLSVNI